MCAIFSWLTSEMDAKRFRAARQSLSSVAHRGPDGGGFAWWPIGSATPVLTREPAISELHVTRSDPEDVQGAGLLLGHRRLSIVDLSEAGHQPMQYAGRYSIVFNGEIYNHIELRRELGQQGFDFHGHCDTEVILAAYAKWGTACLNRFNGMFAFVLYDAAEKRIFAARDRFGVKPLYYWIGPDGSIAIASEIKQFAALPGWKGKVNGQRLYDFIAWGVQDHTSETMYSGVFQLQPGEMLTLQAGHASPTGKQGQLPTQRWYTVPEGGSSKRFEDAAEELTTLLTDSVRLRLRADVPVGSCLSGGLDSSAIVCIVNRLRSEQPISAAQMTFSARSNVARFDEGRYMHAVAEAVHAGHKEVVLDPNIVFESLAELCRWQDEPFGSASIYAQHLVFELAQKNGIRVMLDGQGADEIFAGYGSFKPVHLASLAANMHWMKLARAFVDSRNSIPGGFAYSSRLLVLGLADRYQIKRVKPPLGEKILNLQRLGAEPGTPFTLNDQPARSLRDFSLVNLRTNLPMLLHWEDRNSMAHSVEARLPFLDYRLVEFALNLPDEFKIRSGRTKAVLRQGVDPLLPPVVAQRKDKLGFSTGELDWQSGPLKAAYVERMKRARDECGDLFNANFDSVLGEFETNGAKMVLPWRIICAHEWLAAAGVRLE